MNRDDTATLATTGISDAATSAELAAEAVTRAANDVTEANTRSAAITSEQGTRSAADADLQDQIDTLIAGSGNVPTPSNPADDDKVLTASGGLYDWAPVVASITSGDITDATAIGVTILTAAR